MMIEHSAKAPSATDSKLDRILASEELLSPSSGFVASVMERVREEAAAPAPIPFPWKRLLPGIVVVAGALGWFGVKLTQQGLPDANSFAFDAPDLDLAATQHLQDAGWVACALGLSLLSWLLSRKIVGRSGLL